jgi:hypothetical protein
MRFIIAAGPATALAVALTAVASAAPGIRVAFVTNNQFGGANTFTNSSIPGCPSGSVTDTTSTASFHGPIRLFSGTKLFDCGASGTFTLAYRVHTFGACSPTNSGPWRIEDGTGMYADMSGQGQILSTYLGPDACTHTGSSGNYTGTIRLASG